MIEFHFAATKRNYKQEIVDSINKYKEDTGKYPTRVHVDRYIMHEAFGDVYKSHKMMFANKPDYPKQWEVGPFGMPLYSFTKHEVELVPK